MRVPKETSSQPTQKVRVKPDAAHAAAPTRPKPEVNLNLERLRREAAKAKVQQEGRRLAAIRARTRQPDHGDGPRPRSEGGITTPNGVAQVGPSYRNLKPATPDLEPKYGKG